MVYTDSKIIKVFVSHISFGLFQDIPFADRRIVCMHSYTLKVMYTYIARSLRYSASFMTI